MRIINNIACGEDHPLSNDGDGLLFMRFVDVAMYDQEDSLNELDFGIFGHPGMPRFTHTFEGTGDVVYKPDLKDRIRYKVRVQGRWRRVVDGTNTEGTAWGFVGYLHDGGQWITVDHGPSKPSVQVTSGIDGQTGSIIAGGGTLYLVNSDGDLVRYVHDDRGHYRRQLADARRLHRRHQLPLHHPRRRHPPLL